MVEKRDDKSVLSIALTVLLVLSFVLCITITTQVKTKGIASVGGYSLFRVVTGSMEPTISTGALLLCDDIDIEDIVVGDIICFFSQDKYMAGSVITHRVYKVDTHNNIINLYTKGDANLAVDGYTVTEDNLIGIVRWYTSENNFFAKCMRFLTSKTGFLSGIVLPILITGTIILRNSIKSIMEDLKQASAELEEIKNTPPVTLTEEEYMEIYNKVKAELLEELELNIKYESLERNDFE